MDQGRAIGQRVWDLSAGRVKSRGAGSPARFASALSFFRPLASPQRLLAAMSESRLRPYHAVHHQSPAVIRSIEGRISGEACVGRRLVTRGS
jgi:hypothetical protein